MREIKRYIYERGYKATYMRGCLRGGTRGVFERGYKGAYMRGDARVHI